MIVTKLSKMTEPTTSAGLGILGWKAVGGLTTLLSIAAGLAAIVVMCATPPRSPREWVVGIITTVVGSITGGAALVQYAGIQSWAQEPIGLIALFGVAFACGLPAWALVRSLFTYLERRKSHDIAQIVNEVLDLRDRASK
jgi:hypothetical protein